MCWNGVKGALFGVVLGSTLLLTVVLRIVSGMLQAIGTTMSVFGWLFPEFCFLCVRIFLALLLLALRILPFFIKIYNEAPRFT
jgi:hypothetical protein